MTSIERLEQVMMESEIQRQEFSRQMKESTIKLEESTIKLEESTIKMQESTIEMQEDTKKLKIRLEALGINIDGINKTTGIDTEEFFYSSINKDLQLNGIRFDSSSKNLRVKKNGKTHEMDIFLENGNSVGIIEVKTKVNDKTIPQLDKIIDNFYEFHPSFKNYKVIGAIAGKVFPKHLQQEALKKGYIVITQEGNHIEQRVE